MPETSSKKTPRDILRMVFRRRGLFLLTTSLVAICVMWVAQTLPLKYTGNASFLRESEGATEQERFSGSKSFVATHKEKLREDLMGRKALEALVLKLQEKGLIQGMGYDVPPGPKMPGRPNRAMLDMIEEIQGTVKYRLEVSTQVLDLVKVIATHADSHLAENIPNILVRKYMERVIKKIKEDLEKRVIDLKERLRKAREQLKGSETQKTEFEKDHRDQMPDRPGALEERLRDAEMDKDRLRRQKDSSRLKVARLEDRLRQLTRPVAAPPPTTQPATSPSSTQPTTQPATTQPIGYPVEWVEELNPEKNRLENQLRQFKEQLNAALTLSGMTHKHPTVKILIAKIAELEKRIEDEPEWTTVRVRIAKGPDEAARRAFAAQVIGSNLAAAQSDLDVAVRELEPVEEKIKELNKRIDNSRPVRQAYQRILERISEETDKMKVCKVKFEKAQDALLAQTDEGGGTLLRPLDLAQKQVVPSSPNLYTVLAFAIVGGLICGGGLVFLLNLLDRSITSADDAAKCFDVPIHGVIGEIVTPRQHRMLTVRKWILRPIVIAVVLVAVGVSALNIVVWLHYPDMYAAWRDSPMDFVHREAVTPVVEKAKEVLGSL